MPIDPYWEKIDLQIFTGFFDLIFIHLFIDIKASLIFNNIYRFVTTAE